MRLSLALTAGLICALPAFAHDNAHDHARPEGVAILDYYVNHNPHRTDEQMARDAHRHPEATLAFFGIKPGMTVTEQLPGWYTEILAPMLKDQGKLIGVNVHPDNYPNDSAERRQRRMAFVETWGQGDMFGDTAEAKFLAGPDHQVADESVDMALLFRAFHGMVYSDVADEVLADYFRMLKPGGILGIVQHRDDETSPHAPTDRRGYMKQSYIVDLVTKAGFELLASSEVNANPKDVKTYERGVWTLPPVLTLGEENRDYYRSIGESDRMTLKFIKPVN